MDYEKCKENLEHFQLNKYVTKEMSFAVLNHFFTTNPKKFKLLMYSGHGRDGAGSIPFCR